MVTCNFVPKFSAARSTESLKTLVFGSLLIYIPILREGFMLSLLIELLQ